MCRKRGTQPLFRKASLTHDSTSLGPLRQFCWDEDMVTRKVIDVQELTVSYGKFTAVEELSFEVQQGELYALLGTNGAGKTSALETIEGHRRPSSGTIRVFDQDPRDRRSVRPRMGIMLQESGFAPSLRVGETVELFGAVSGRQDDKDRVLQRVGLSHKDTVQVSQLSGGEKRRLDFATAIYGDPELVFLDEPTTGLDIEARDELWQVVSELRDQGATLVLTTHYLEEAQEHADRIGLMHRGRLELEGTFNQLAGSFPTTISFSTPEYRGEVPVPVDTTDRGWKLQTQDPQRDLFKLLQWSEEKAIRISNLSVQPASLDDIFRTLSN